MTGASSLAFPASRTLANWWRQLAPYDAEALWVGYLFLHRLEARVTLLENQALDTLSHLLLLALDLESRSADATGLEMCDRLDRRLHVGRPLLRQLLHRLADQGLIQADNEGSRQLSDLGRHALVHRGFPWSHDERRILTFVERLDPSGQRIMPPHYLGVAEAPGLSWDVPPATTLDVELLRSAVKESDEWKKSFGFPGEVQGLLERRDESQWRDVIVDHPERLLAVFFLSGKGSEGRRLLGFAARPDGWVLESRAPIIDLPVAARLASPDLSEEISASRWQKAWLAWCQARQLPQSEAAACQLAYAGARLRVAAPVRLVQRLQSARSEIFKGEAWVVEGEGYIRAVARLEMERT